MFHRLTWLCVSVLLAVALMSWGVAYSAKPEALHDVVVNEWSQGNGGTREWVELLVLAGPLDMRGWDMGDSSAGDLAMSNDPLWSSVPTGTLIVVYNGSDRDTILPPDDFDPADCVLILPHNDPLYFAGGWPGFSNSTTTDNPHVRDAADATVHDFSAEPGSSLHPGANETAQFNGDTAVLIADPAQWSNNTASTASPGSGNGGLNTVWVNQLCGSDVVEPDLAVAKSGPTAVMSGDPIVYQISLSNNGNLTATGVVLTDSLPVGLTYVADSSGLPLSQPDAQTLVWQVGDVLTSSSISFHLTTTLDTAVSGVITNTITAVTALSETNTADNTATASTLVNSTGIWLDAVHYYGYAGDTDEAVALRNVGPETADLSNWQLSDGATTAVLPPGASLLPGQVAWLANEAVAFYHYFGFLPDWETADTHPAVPQLSGSWPGFSNSGDEVLLSNASAILADVLVYQAGDTGQIGWSGAAVQPYVVSGVFAEEGQILYRRREQTTGLPVPDTDSATDWAQMTGDVVNGRKVLYPGWDLDTFFFTAQITETAVLTIAIAPDNAYAAIVQEINAAQTSIQIETHTIENVALAEALISAVQRGVSVTLLLEGAPPGGLPDQEKYICQELESAGGQCWFMVSDADADVYDRYRYLHAKFLLIDGRKVIISSENLSPNSLPNDDKSDGTWGRRGVVLITDAPGVVNHVQTIFDADFDPAAHTDLYRWAVTHTVYGPPPIGFVPITVTGGTTYTVRYLTPTRLVDSFAFELVQSPENSLRDQDGLLGLVNQAGAGDVVWVQQLQERPYWGNTSSNAQDDPNPRLEAYIAAAQRGAEVRLLLDAFFDTPTDPTSNASTCLYINQIAQDEHLDMRCAVSNPSGLGIHNKMVLVQLDGVGYVHVGSINGTEQSSKGNRELALQVQSNDAYALLADLFNRDWPHRAYLPMLRNGYLGPANHLLISEVLYDPPGQDDAEFVELYNPTPQAIDLSNFSLGDAVNSTDFEDVRRFPAGTVLAAGDTLVIATSATAFYAQYGFNPDFEVVDTETAVPNLLDDLAWGDPAATMQFGNSGDEIILRNILDQLVDIVVYGDGSYPGVVACPVVSAANHSLERYPAWRDSDGCTADFRDWPFPNPGSLP